MRQQIRPSNADREQQHALAPQRVGEAAILPLRVFRSSVFSITSVTSLLVGAGMFGGLVVLLVMVMTGNNPMRREAAPPDTRPELARLWGSKRGG